MRRKIHKVYVVCLYPDRVVETGPIGWFDAMKTMAVHFGDCKAVDEHGRVFARAECTADFAAEIRMERGDRPIVGKGEGTISPAAAIDLAERYSWRAPIMPDLYRAAAEDRRNA
jgi:hypothetical protein